MIMVLGEVPKLKKFLYKLTTNNGETRGEASLDISVTSLFGDPPVLLYNETERVWCYSLALFLIPM